MKVEFVCKECSNRKIYGWKKPRTKMGEAARPFKVFGGLLKMTREHLGWDVRAVARAVGVTDPGTVRSWERGTDRPKGPTLRKIREFYNLDEGKLDMALEADRLLDRKTLADV